MGCGSTKSVAPDAAKVIMLGPSTSGKTQILYMLKLKQIIQTIPTVGFNCETVPAPRNYVFTIFDFGGDTSQRPTWKKSYPNCDGLLYVVDSANAERLGQAKDVLFGELSDQNLRGVPLLVLANKTDLPGAQTPAHVQESLHLKAIIDRPWALDPVCGIHNEGLDVAMADLARMIGENRRMKNALKHDKKLNRAVV